MTHTVGPLYKLGWELTQQVGFNCVTWKVEDGDIEVWAGHRYFIVTQPDPDTFIVTEEREHDFEFMEGRKVWRDWSDAAHDVIARIKGPRK